MTARPSLRYSLQFLTDFHVGSGLGTALVDALLVQDRHGNVYIPGWTMKGIWRMGCEAVAQNLGRQDLLRLVFEGDGGQPAYHFSDATLDPAFELMTAEVRGASRVLASAQRSVVMRTSIDPGTRRVAEKKLFSREEGVAQLTFAGTTTRLVPGSSGIRDEFLFLWAGARYVRSLGGGRRRGVGACRIDVETFEPEDVDLEPLTSVQGAQTPNLELLATELRKWVHA